MLWLDYETYSSTDIDAGVYAYCEDPTFDAMMCGWTTDQVNYHLAVGEREISKIPGLFDSRVKKVAQNAPFERIVTSTIAGMPVGTYFPPEDYIDTLILAAGNGYPKGLDKMAKALGAEPKDTAGTALINFFCKPYRGQRRMPKDHPEKWKQFKDYCVQDVRTLVDVWNRLPHDLPPMEQRVWLADQTINDRGIKVDLALARKAVVAAEENEAAQRREVIQLTGVVNPGSTQQLTKWFKDNGLVMPNMKAETVEAMLNRPQRLDVRRVLELRQDLALVASKKYLAALRSTNSDGRLRGTLRFYGAHTGRWSGRGVQLHNLPRLSFSKVVGDEEEYDMAAQEAAILDLMMGLGASPEDLKRLVRPLFLGPFAIVDLSAIEARIIAWLAGEEWMLKAFREGKDLYVETAHRLGPKYKRKDGKVATLALGYQGAVNSLRVMGATGTDEELKAIVWKWRAAAPKIVAFWARLNAAFITGGRAGRITVVKEGNTRRVILPSGRVLTYRGVRVVQGDYGPRILFDDPRGFVQDTYGGRLAENVTQATARDVLAEIIVRLEDAGFRVASHVHDEALVETQDLAAVERIACEVPDWATGLPLDASGFVSDRYRKEA